MVPFLQLAAEKKTPFLVQIEFFLPFSYCDGFSNRVRQIFISEKQRFFDSKKDGSFIKYQRSQSGPIA